MQERTSISASEFCSHHHIEITFLQELHEYGLIKLDTSQEEESSLDADELPMAEKLVRLHYDLHINLEGLDAIHHLLQKIEDLQKEVGSLRQRLRQHENE